MNVNLEQSSVARAFRQKAQAERRAIICYPFRHEGRMVLSAAGRVAMLPDGRAIRLGQTVTTRHGVGQVVAMVPDHRRGGVSFKVRRASDGWELTSLGWDDLVAPRPGTLA